jgi:hypothetical protein
MPSVNIRKAIIQDCPAMLELVHELALYERAPQEVTVTLDHFIESGFGANPVWWAFVAEEEGVVKGFALYYIRYSTWKGQKMYSYRGRARPGNGRAADGSPCGGGKRKKPARHYLAGTQLERTGAEFLPEI